MRQHRERCRTLRWSYQSLPQIRPPELQDLLKVKWLEAVCPLRERTDVAYFAPGRSAAGTPNSTATLACSMLPPVSNVDGKRGSTRANSDSGVQRK